MEQPQRATNDKALSVNTNASILNHNSVTCCIYFRRRKLDESANIGNIPKEQTETKEGREASSIEIIESEVKPE